MVIGLQPGGGRVRYLEDGNMVPDQSKLDQIWKAPAVRLIT